MNIADLDIDALVAGHGTPLMVISRHTLLDNYRRLQAELPGVRLCYAVKSHLNGELLRVLAEAGSGFDIATRGELDEVLALELPNPDIVHSNPIKGFGEIEYAAKKGIDTFFYDNVHELDKIAHATPGAQVMLRLAVDNPNCVVDLGAKFGCAFEEAHGLLMAAVERALIPRGLSFHVGSQTSIPLPYVEMIVGCRQLFNRMALAGQPLRTLDIGGGFPVSYKTRMMSLESFCKPIREALASYFPDTEVIAEPGRALSAAAAAVVTRVIGKASRQGVTWYYLDDGVYGVFSGCVFDKARYEFRCLTGGDPEPCVLAGPTCDSFDVIAKGEFLPPLEIGDVVVADNMGAYTAATATRFNSTRPCSTLMVD